MRPFPCSTCQQLLFFDNTACLQCGSGLGFVVDELQLVALVPVDDNEFERGDGGQGRYRRCENELVARCNWLLPSHDHAELCKSCSLTSVRPHEEETESAEAFALAETAKRRLLYQLMSLGLPVIDRAVDEQNGVTFELLSSRGRNVITGHDGGVITLDLSESDDVHREFVRKQMGEPYRTVLGHLRHEIAHYYWPALVEQAGLIESFRALFGDERVSYANALERHYNEAPNDDWSTTHVSHYATMHPWEDWAETFAHYLHIEAGLGTASGIGLAVTEPALSAGRQAWNGRPDIDIDEMIQGWLGLTLGLNAMARSIGQSDLYPFVLSPMVVEKLDFVHRSIQGHASHG